MFATRHPLLVLTSLAFWSMIWGVAGAFLSVPLTASIVIAFKHIPSCRWIAILLADDVALDEQARE